MSEHRHISVEPSSMPCAVIFGNGLLHLGERSYIIIHLNILAPQHFNVHRYGYLRVFECG